MGNLSFQFIKVADERVESINAVRTGEDREMIYSSKAMNSTPPTTGNIIHGRQKGVYLNFQMKNPTATSPIMMPIILGNIKPPF